ncbi:hypothetical protein [Enterococcus ratti]|uniref:Uncharacterized protein n=1 Tax=Enterococcus ratti TaxID=150033 RepID=A0A1L8WNR1_9ENTE|nr:hypothetical protein [Enterococcus ratti]OJG82661.1 hypothetical protein RV14_GL002236 [Enterococcus ratti]
MFRICSKKAIRSKALTIRLFDGSTWANLGNGQFINQTTKKEISSDKIYPKIKTAVSSGGILFAKRMNAKQILQYVEHPIKVKTW